MFIERLVLFLVLGFFVFSPTVGEWTGISLSEWYRNYVPWLALISLCGWLRYADREPANQQASPTTPPDKRANEDPDGDRVRS